MCRGRTAVSERVLLAERHGDGRYEVCRSQWSDVDHLLRAVAEGAPAAELRQDGTWTACGRWDCQDLLDELSYLNLALCIECGETDPAGFLPVWAGIPTGKRDQTPAHCGVLVRVDSLGEYDRLRRRLRQQKARLGRAVERGELSVESAQRRLLAGLRARIEYAAVSARQLLADE